MPPPAPAPSPTLSNLKESDIGIHAPFHTLVNEFVSRGARSHIQKYETDAQIRYGSGASIPKSSWHAHINVTGLAASGAQPAAAATLNSEELGEVGHFR